MINQLTYLPENESVVLILESMNQLSSYDSIITLSQKNYLEKFLDKLKFIQFNNYDKYIFFVLLDDTKSFDKQLETLRIYGNKIAQVLNNENYSTINISYASMSDDDYKFALAEGIELSNYQFNNYKPKKNQPTLKNVNIITDKESNEKIKRINSLINGVAFARDIVNQPLSFMTAKKLSEVVKEEGQKSGFQVKILDKKKIESLKMGGILAVNRGSVEPPTFTIIEYNPPKAINKKPYILVGKGLVFDTGGYNLKPTSSMATMKSDKAGAAAVAGTISAIAQAELPIYIIGLIPATENRIGATAYVPDDIITMYDGTTVEIVNTDAEGRLVLADALSYAKQYEPELVIDIATLTGAAVIAVGEKNTAIIGNTQNEIDKMIKCGFKVWERQIQLPLWDDFADDLQSQIAELKNTGKWSAGTIVAAAFLKHFTDYPWIHLDIAGPAYSEKNDSYRSFGASAVPTRMLFEYFLEKATKHKE